MIVTIHQPEHLPWLGFFNKIAKAEIVVLLDGVQYEKNYFQNRNRILGTNGIQWINIPVSMKGHMGNTIAQMKIANDCVKNWKLKYLQTIQMSYKKYPYFLQVYPILENAIMRETNLLCEINISIIKGFASALSIEPKYMRSSEMKAYGFKSDLILNICREVEADTYIAGPSGRNYLDVASFEESGIKVRYNDYVHPEYPQSRTTEFVSHLSALDLFMNCGFEESKRIIMNDNIGLSNK